MSEDKLINFLKTGKDWSRLRTSVPGVFVLKLPTYKSTPTRLAVELNPLDETGRVKKRRGLVLRTDKELDDFKEMFEYEKLSKLLKMIDQVNPKVEPAKRTKAREEVLEL